MLIWIKSIYNLVVLMLSITTFSIVARFVNLADEVLLPSSPKALVNLQSVFLPPLINL